MGEKLHRAPFTGEIKIGNTKIPCAVLEDGTRLLTQQGFLRAMGRSRSAKGGTGSSVDGMIPFLSANNLKPFISEELLESTTPVRFRTEKGAKAFGYKANLLPKVCEVYLQARDAGVLTANQKKIAVAADIIIRGLAHIGITALIDEATGYQEVRDRKALEKILEKWIAKELLPWTKRFPDDFYKEMFRLKGWPYDPASVKRPQVIGHITNDIVYERLETGVLKELQKQNPPIEPGRRKHKHHQWLTEDVGDPKLREHLAGVIALMKAAPNWRRFVDMLNRVYQKKGHTIPLPLEDE